MPDTIPIADTVAMPAGIEPIDHPSADAFAQADWPEVDRSLLQDGRPSLPDFPLQALPPRWRAWVSETAHATGARIPASTAVIIRGYHPAKVRTKVKRYNASGATHRNGTTATSCDK